MSIKDEENKTITESNTSELTLGEIDQNTLSKYDHKHIDNDLKYNAPLSYRYLRLIGWIMMAITFVSMVLGAVFNLRAALESITPEQMEAFEKVSGVLSFFSALPLPLFLIANFAIILQQKNNYKKLIFTHLKMLLIVYIGFLFVYYHYVVILLMRVMEMSFADARELSIVIFTSLGKQSGLVVNVFVDLFCCVLIMFFIDYVPKKYFQGKKIILFRLLVLLPILYEIGSAILMGLLGLSDMVTDFTFALPPEILPLIGKKPIGMIFGFVLICIYVKIRDKRYIKRGGTLEGYDLYLQTKRNSFYFSVVMAIIFLVIAVIDFLALLLPVVITAKNGQDLAAVETLMNALTNFSIGKSVCLILVIPFVLLFSYTKQHKDQKLDKLLPIIGVGLVIFSIIETAFFSILF